MTQPKYQSGISTVLIIIVVAVVAVGGSTAAYFATDGFGMNKADTSSDTSTGSSDNKDATPEDKSVSAASIVDILKGGTDIRCDVEIDNETTKSLKGVAYLTSSQQYRADYTYTEDGQTKEMHMIGKDSKTYMWAEDNKGFAFDATAEQNSDDPDFSPEGIEKWAEEDESGAQVDCERAGSVDTSLFELPADVTFTDFSSLYR